MFTPCYLRALKSSWLIQLLAGAACIANQGGLAVRRSRPYEVSVRDKDVGTAGVLCLLPSVKSASLPPSLSPALPRSLFAPFLSPSKAPEVGGCFPQGRRSVLYGWPMNIYLF